MCYVAVLRGWGGGSMFCDLTLLQFFLVTIDRASLRDFRTKINVEISFSLRSVAWRPNRRRSGSHFVMADVGSGTTWHNFPPPPFFTLGANHVVNAGCSQKSAGCFARDTTLTLRSVKREDPPGGGRSTSTAAFFACGRR